MADEREPENGLSWRKRLLISVAIGLSLIPVWQLSDNRPGRLGIIACVAAAVFVLSLALDKVREGRG